MRKILCLFLFPLFTFSQTINKNLMFENINREYIIYIPSSYDGTKSMPILFMFHGGSDYAANFINFVDVRSIADTAGFIAVYPQGALDGGTTSWIHKAPTSHNDVNFISVLIDTISNNYLIDFDRVYACGYSEGGIFSYELACRLNNKIAAIASVSGSMLTDSYRSTLGFGLCNPIHPTAILLFPGTDDFNPHSSYNGLSPYYYSVNDIIDYWSNYNNTDIIPAITQLTDLNPNDGSTVEKKVWQNGDQCTQVIEFKVYGGGHDWPGISGNMDISASEEIWNFLSKFDINGKIDCNSSSSEENLNSNIDKKLIKVINVLGSKTNRNKSSILFYLFDDGSIEKRLKF